MRGRWSSCSRRGRCSSSTSSSRAVSSGNACAAWVGCGRREVLDHPARRRAGRRSPRRCRRPRWPARSRPGRRPSAGSRGRPRAWRRRPSRRPRTSSARAPRRAGSWPTISRVASMPFSSGICRSMTITSGCSSSAAARPPRGRWRPRRRRRSRPGAASSMRSPLRNTGWSSAIRTRSCFVGRPRSLLGHRQARQHSGASPRAPGRCVHVPPSSAARSRMEPRPTLGRASPASPAPSSVTSSSSAPSSASRTVARPAPAWRDDVGEGLEGDPVGRHLDAPAGQPRQRRPVTTSGRAAPPPAALLVKRPACWQAHRPARGRRGPAGAARRPAGGCRRSRAGSRP